MNRIIAKRMLKLRTRLLEISKTKKKVIACPVPWDGVQEIHFNMDDWFNVDEDQDEDFCSTSACVLGHAALMPEFQKLGLKVRMYDTTTGDIPRPAGVDFDKYSDYSAGKHFFELTDFEANALFYAPADSDDADNTPGFRARVIVSLIRQHHPDLVTGLPGAPEGYFQIVAEDMEGNSSVPEEYRDPNVSYDETDE